MSLLASPVVSLERLAVLQSAALHRLVQINPLLPPSNVSLQAKTTVLAQVLLCQCFLTHLRAPSLHCPGAEWFAEEWPEFRISIGLLFWMFKATLSSRGVEWFAEEGPHLLHFFFSVAILLIFGLYGEMFIVLKVVLLD